MRGIYQYIIIVYIWEKATESYTLINIWSSCHATIECGIGMGIMCVDMYVGVSCSLCQSDVRIGTLVYYDKPLDFVLSRLAFCIYMYSTAYIPVCGNYKFKPYPDAIAGQHTCMVS